MQNLQPDPAQQTAYYMQQNVAMLAQISRQISSIAPQLATPATPPPPFPTFKPLASDVRANVFWFMALIFSLSAALLATLVQQWVRDYMHVFQRYDDPLKSARLRQYLYDGVEGWYMPVLAGAVPGLLHVSLILFFIGLVDFLLNINTTIGVSTTIPIGICGLFYIFTMFAPIVYPQSPYQNSFSGLIWYVNQKLRGRRYKDRGSSGALKQMSSNMAEGQMQLAMEETEERKERDKTAIRWLVNNLTEDAEMESFAMAIPGSFNTEWGAEVWKGMVEDENKSTNENELVARPLRDMALPISLSPVPAPERVSAIRNLFGPISRLVRTRSANNYTTVTRGSHPAPHLINSHLASIIAPGRENYAVHELSRRVGRLLETCSNRSRFASEDLWRKRTRACVQTTALLVCANAQVGWLADIGKFLEDVGSLKNIYVQSMEELDQSFIAPWTCLSIMAIRVALVDESLRKSSRTAVSALAHLRSQDGTHDDQALKNAQKIDRDLNIAWDCLPLLRHSLCVINGVFWEPREREQARENLLSHDSQISISQLERIHSEAGIMADRVKRVEACITDAYREMHRVTHELPCQLLVQSNDALQEPASFGSLVTPIEQQSISLHERLQGFCSIYSKLQDIIEGRNNEEYEETIRSVRWQVDFDYSRPKSRRCPMEKQLAHLQDLSDSGGFGCIVELFFLTLEKLLSTSSKEFHQALYVLTLKNITSDWKMYKHSLGTQKVILEVFCDVAMRPYPQESCSNHSSSFLFPSPVVYRGSDEIEPPPIPSFPFPSPIACELLVLLRNMIEGQTGPHIDSAMERLRTVRDQLPDRLRDKHGDFLEAVLEVISRSRAPSGPPPPSL